MSAPVQAEPTFTDVLEARRSIRPHLAPTPLRNYPSLDRLSGLRLWVKHENLLPTGAFKVRGGINLVSRLPPEERRAGVIAASTGNHGQSVAYAAQLFGVSAIVCAPVNANPVKVESMEALGAEVVLHGANYDEARQHCEELARRNGFRYIHSGDEPLLIAGVATQALETLEEQPALDALILPIGGGSGAAGAVVVASAVRPGLEIYGVQSEQAPAAHRSWRAGRLEPAPNTTAVEGLATGTAFELPQRILRDRLTDFLLVSDAEIEAAAALLIEKTRTLVEPAGGAALAAAIRLRERLAGRQVAVTCSGANISPAQLRRLLDAVQG